MLCTLEEKGYREIGLAFPKPFEKSRLQSYDISRELGTVPQPRAILMEGEWVEDESTPGP